MISRDSDEYLDICNRLSIPSNMGISIPRSIITMDDNMLNMIRDIVSRMTNPYDITRVLNRYRVRNAPSSTQTHSDSVYHKYRAFFITSDTSIGHSDIKVEGNNPVVRMYGGRCLQLITHYHYYFIVEYAVAIRGISIRCNGHYTVQGIYSNTNMCHEYIRAQVMPDRVLDYCKTNHQTDSWYNPKYHTDINNILFTNNYGLGGVYDNISEREGDLVVITELSEYSYSVFNTKYYHSTCTNKKNYHKDYNIAVQCGNNSRDMVYSYFNKSDEFKYSKNILLLGGVKHDVNKYK